MMASTVNQKLSSYKILDKLRLNSNKYLNLKESRSLVAVYEQRVFVWHDTGSCILTAEINGSQMNDDSFKMLTMTNPPLFEVERLQFNQTGNLLVLSGKNGVMVYQVPWRYGKFGTAHEKDECIMGRSWNVAEHFFVYSNRVGVVQTEWHPGSNSNTHLTVLSTDNYIRIYDVIDPPAPQQVISLGSGSKGSYLSSDAKVSFSTCFGEIPVSFDFGPPEMMQQPEPDCTRELKTYYEEKIWPIFLLHGNGDVYILKAPMKKTRFQLVRLEGPMAMYPPAEDNYGYDACSLLCLLTVPTTVVIATATGMIYHCLVLENSNSSPNKEQEFEASWFLVSQFDECDAALYVFESVELPLSLTEEQDDIYSHPIRLYKDVTSYSKYHCSHVSGVHSVAVPFLQSIQECLETDTLGKLLMGQQKQHCIVEHILCTKPFSQTDAIPVLGLDITVHGGGITMICLLASWEFVFLPLVSTYFPNVPHLLSEDMMNPKEEKPLCLTFEQHIEKTLQRSLCSPFLKSCSSADQMKTSPQQWLDLLCNVTQRFREDYIQRLSTAHALLRSRVKVLTQQKEYQLRDLENCKQNQKELRDGAERLAEKYEDAQANQQLILARLENVLKKLQSNLPYLSKSEIEMKQTLLSYHEKIKTFEYSLDQIKKKIKYQAEKKKELGSSRQLDLKDKDVKDLNFNDTQMKHVKELLSQEGDSIADLTKTIGTLKKQIGL